MDIYMHIHLYKLILQYHLYKYNTHSTRSLRTIFTTGPNYFYGEAIQFVYLGCDVTVYEHCAEAEL